VLVFFTRDDKNNIGSYILYFSLIFKIGALLSCYCLSVISSLTVGVDIVIKLEVKPLIAFDYFDTSPFKFCPFCSSNLLGLNLSATI